MSKNEYLNKKRKKALNKEGKENIKENIIIAKIKVEKYNLKKRIINSYENFNNENGFFLRR